MSAQHKRSVWDYLFLGLALASLFGILGFVLVSAFSPFLLISPPKDRSDRSCITQLKKIDGAVQAWSLEYKHAPTDTYSLSDPTYLAFLKGSVLPECPKGGRYTAGTNIADVPKCDIPGHTL